MTWLPLCVVIFAMAVMVTLHNDVMNPRAMCPLCGGRKEHGRNCPQRDRDE